MLCAVCGEATEAAPCSACGGEPRVDGRYALLEVVGRGAVATTYRARGPDGAVAVKEAVLRPGEATKVQELVLREAAVLRQLGHPMIPAYIEDLTQKVGRVTHLFLVQAWVEGVDLQQRAIDHRTEEREVLRLLRELCDVLTYLHERSPPIIHRDLKPANILRRPDGTHALVDFGSVRDALRQGDTGGSTVAGTFGYMAPEQFAGDAEPRTDLYGLGALAIALLTRQDPATLQAPDRRLGWRHLTTLSDPAAALLDRLTAVDLADRPASARVLAAQLDTLLRAPAPPPAEATASEPAPVTLAPPPLVDEPEPFHQPPVVHGSATPATGPTSSDGDEPEDFGSLGLVALTVAVLVTTAIVTGAVVLAALP